MERPETLALEQEIRARWRAVESRAEPSLPLARACARWEAMAERLMSRAPFVDSRLAPPREKPVPEDAFASLHENAPQAILRDLHRPAFEFTISEYEHIALGWDRAAAHAVAEVKSWIVRHYRVPIAELLQTGKLVEANRRELAELKSLPAETAPKMHTGGDSETSE